MKKITSLIACTCFTISVFAQTVKPAYLDESQPIEKRVEDALTRMTLEEKVKMCHAQSKFSSYGVPRLGIPELWMSDGPHGIREEVLWDEWNGAHWTSDSCIAFPALTCLAATWDPQMATLYGKSIGEEARYRKKDVLLGPGVNIYRTPLNGRNFEYMGEDPFLISRMVIPYIKGVQSNGVAACVKHFALNNQEIDRGHINVIVDDRALHEIYLPAFKAAVQEAGVWSVMGAYNQYKGQQCCHNQYLLNDILKQDWQFDGVVISDWGGVHNTEQAANFGLDLEMGTWTDGLSQGKTNAYDNYYLAEPLLKKIKKGEINIKVVDDKVRRLLKMIFRTVMNSQRPWGSFGTEEHALAGRTIAENGIVLLKNDKNILPINLNKIKKIAVVGENATKRMTLGGGSSSLKVKYEITPLDGLKKQIGNLAEIIYVKGYVSPLTEKRDPKPEIPVGYKEPNPEILLQEAINAAKDADIVLYFGGLNKNENQDSEGNDRKSYNLPYGQDRLISELAKVNKNIVVTIISGNAVAMPWIKEVPAIVEGWFGGTESGNAIASILTGKVNPSGKLPMTIAEKLEDYPSHALGEYPGDHVNVRYNEGIFIGYRWIDKQKKQTLFPFGHGLSYTTFDYGKIKISSKQMRNNDKITISIPIKNSGKIKGKETVQLYIGDEKCSFERPIKELKGFSKIELNPGEEKIVTFEITDEAFKFYDDKQKIWRTEPGKFKIYIGASSNDIRETSEITLL
ncbi:glycoside hydrolase family 3 C-terminal domain-containing protein [Coprobacter secundus]|jgi:candidate beta-glycosidase; glycoside hydrolase family 3|uniref:glycoside hydrolase family 3 C-terminal domain-containing protein n=1 Tax=Coprobacter secundus TaxID=1501392 RepID=UPI0005757E0D|nr:glycoside hydrolase family 3 C-terminal domain-containing protein [Coprobacter secundus]KHM44176.1 glycosyl hydrolase family 3 [Coprobacter secundus]